MIPLDIKLLFKILRLHIKHKGLKWPTIRFLFIQLPLIVLNNLFHQFFFILDEIFFPSYRKIETDRTIFIIGPPRCGTSLLLDLLNHSSEISSMKLWELHYAPSICEKLFWLQIGKIDRFLGSPLSRIYLKINDKILGGFKDIHYTSLFHFEEDAMVFYHTGNSPFYLFVFPFNELKSSLVDLDQSTLRDDSVRYMKYYKKCIQKHLFVFGKQKIYLSKNPLFSTRILTLKEHFNKARFIFLTRTPYEVVPSTISLATHFKHYTHYLDSVLVRIAIMEMLRKQYLYPLEVLDFSDTRHHVMIQFVDLVADSKATVEKVLEQFQIVCPEELKKVLSERAKRDYNYVSRNKYSFEKYNISDAHFNAHFKQIISTFGYEEQRRDNQYMQNATSVMYDSNGTSKRSSLS
ncbi:MAG: sulfotransferase [Desulfobacteraceae bacterium]